MTQLIRSASNKDAASLILLDDFAGRSERRRQFIEESINRKECYIALIDSSIVGYIILDYTFFDNAFVPLLIVSSTHRRKGVGITLMRHVESVCKTRKLFTSTNLSNLPMQLLLLKLEYSLTGVIHNLDPGDPELVYIKHRTVCS